MSINENTGEFITESEAIELTHAFQASHPSEIRSFFAGKSKLSSILAQEGCVGLRIYNAKNTNGAKTVVLVGVNSAGEDMTHGQIMEFLEPCPTVCPKNSVLMKPVR